MKHPFTSKQIHQLVQMALEEDLGCGDLTTRSIVTKNKVMEAEVSAKEPLVLCGVAIFKAVFTYLDSEAAFPEQPFVDGDKVSIGKLIIKVKARFP